MTISPPERGNKKAKVSVDRTPVPVDFDVLRQAGHFEIAALAKVPKPTNLGLEPPRQRSRIFDSHTSDLEEVSRKIFRLTSATWRHFHLLSGAFYHRCPLQLQPVGWPIP